MTSSSTGSGGSSNVELMTARAAVQVQYRDHVSGVCFSDPSLDFQLTQGA